MKRDTKKEMTKLEAFVWNNPHVDQQVLANQLNRSLTAVEQAWDRAHRKSLLRDQANVISGGAR